MVFTKVRSCLCPCWSRWNGADGYIHAQDNNDELCINTVGSSHWRLFQLVYLLFSLSNAYRSFYPTSPLPSCPLSNLLNASLRPSTC